MSIETRPGFGGSGPQVRTPEQTYREAASRGFSQLQTKPTPQPAKTKKAQPRRRASSTKAARQIVLAQAAELERGILPTTKAAG